MSQTMGIGVSGIVAQEGEGFFSMDAEEAKELFGPTEFKPDKMSIPVMKNEMLS